MAMGWAWYCVTLLPVLGLIQVGEQARADRYTYVPLLGVFLAVAWGAPWLAARWTGMAPARLRQLGAAATVLAAVACVLATRHQTTFWRDSETLFTRALAVTDRNHVAHINLALARTARGDRHGAMRHYESALSIRPDSSTAHNNLGRLLVVEGRLDEALPHYRAAIAIQPTLPEAHGNLGVALARLGRVPESIDALHRAVKLDPRSAPLRYNLGTSLAAAGRTAAAEEQFRAAITLEPTHGAAHASLAAALFLRGDHDGAWREIRAARKHGTEPPRALIEQLARVKSPPAD
jgi:Flp pilus assembly protein TadD